MARKKNTKKRRSGLLGALVLLILLGVMAYKLVEVYGDLSAAKEQEARLGGIEFTYWIEDQLREYLSETEE